jgi:hypothetical protein
MSKPKATPPVNAIIGTYLFIDEHQIIMCSCNV